MILRVAVRQLEQFLASRRRRWIDARHAASMPN
jgi:hypothetical protein